MKGLKSVCVFLLGLGSVVMGRFVVFGQSQSLTDAVPPYVWEVTPDLGDRYRVKLDTAMLNFNQVDNPASFSLVSAYTGTLGAPIQSEVFFNRPIASPFLFIDPYKWYYKLPGDVRYYNTRLPMAKLTYTSAGESRSATDHFSAEFSGNFNKRLEFGGRADLLMARGVYDRQGVANNSFELFGSYMGDKYQIQGFVGTHNLKNQENGGITDDVYINNPEEVQGGKTLIDPKTIPVRLSNAYNYTEGYQGYVAQRYNLGFYKKENPDDTTEQAKFIPVSSITHTLHIQTQAHSFSALNLSSSNSFFRNNYFNAKETNDSTHFLSVKNTIGLSLLEGFHKYAKAGLSAYITYDYRRYRLMDESADSATVGTNRWPMRSYSEHLLWVGGVFKKEQGRLLTYMIDGKVGLLGAAIGEIDLIGNIQTRFPLFKETVTLKAEGYFKNMEPSFYFRRYVSNHFIWNNDFGKERRLRLSGELSLDKWRTNLMVGVENLQNYVYYDTNAQPKQLSSLMQVFNVTLKQDFVFGVFHWDNELTYQKSTNEEVLALPDLSLYTNMYLWFRIAKVLHSQIGIDLRYFTEYYAPNYQPATVGFYNQREQKIGGYPLVNVYATFRLKQARFYVMYSHANQGLFGSRGYFSMPSYPINPAVFQFGINIDLTN